MVAENIILKKNNLGSIEVVSLAFNFVILALRKCEL